MFEKRRRIKPLALLLALTMVLTGIEWYAEPPMEAEAADKIIDVGSSLADWAVSSAGRHEILSWNEATDRTKDVHMLKKSNGTRYLAWYQKNKTATTTAHYRTDGYHLTKGVYTLGDTSIKMGNPSCYIMEGDGLGQIKFMTSGAQHYDLFYVEYDPVLEMCDSMDLKPQEDGNGSFYLVYFQPYISCFNSSGTKVCTKGETYNTVHDWFKKLYSAATQADLKEKYNVKFRIPIKDVPIVVRYWDVTKSGKATLMYGDDGKEYVFNTGEYATADSDRIMCDVDVNKALEKCKTKLTSAVKTIYDENKINRGNGILVGCQTYVGAGEEFVLSKNYAFHFGFKTLREEDKLYSKKEYTVATDNRSVKVSMDNRDLTPVELLENIQKKCVFKDVMRGNSEVDGGMTTAQRFHANDKCYVDILFMQQNLIPVEYGYEITRTIADYNPSTKKIENSKGVGKLDEDEIGDENKTSDGKFTLTIGKKAHPDYTESAAGKALGNVVVDGHKYVLAQAGLSVKEGDAKKAKAWNNVHEKASDWAGGSSLNTLGSKYAYGTTALNKKLASYRYYTDSKKIDGYGDGMIWTIRMMYVCRPPMVQLNYSYDKSTKKYKLLSTVPTSVSSPDKLAFEYANSKVKRSVNTECSGKSLQRVLVTTGKIKPYDGSSSYTNTQLPDGTMVTEKELENSDRSKSKYDISFTMPYDTTFLVCVYGDDPGTFRERKGDTPGYTEVSLRKVSGGYEVFDYNYYPDPDPNAEKVTVSFDKERLKDVGYTYAKTNQPSIPSSYPSKPAAKWGCKPEGTYEYVSPEAPKLNQNLIVYGLYEEDVDIGEDKLDEKEEPSPGEKPDWVDGDDSSKAKELKEISDSADDMRAWIANDYKASTSRDYDVETAIPTSEYLNTYAKVFKYLTFLDQIKHTSKYTATIKVNEEHYVWVPGTRYSPGYWAYAGTVHHRRDVSRTTVYYTVDDGNVLTPMDCTIFNNTLTLDEQVTMQAENKYWENDQLRFEITKGAETKLPEVMRSTTIYSYGSYAADSTVQAAAEGCVGEYTSHDDVVQFGNGEGTETQLSDDTFVVINDRIREAPEAGYTRVAEGERVFDKWGVFIPADRINGTHDSTAVVHYRTWGSTKGSIQNKLLGIYCNEDVIHTPAMCNCWLVTDENKVQKLQPSVRKNLVLDTPFSVFCTATGYFTAYPGYGSRDYQKWLYTDVFDNEPIKAMQVKFPFAVMRHSEVTGLDMYYVANTWIPVPIGETEFYVPSWDDEVDLTAARWRAIAENVEALNSYSTDDGRTLKPVSSIESMMYQSRLDKIEYTTNYSISNYVGWMEELTSISGRIYDMGIFDVTDYPVWERVFRTGSTTKPNELTGFKYTSGLKNRDGFANGSVSESTFPMVKGSNKYDARAGALKPGYAIRFSFETVGMLDDDNDVIKISPSFVWISKDETQRKDVDVYYNETFGGKKHQFVKVGSNLDATNRHALTMGDDVWGIEQDAIDRTASARGLSSAKELMDRKEYCWSPGQISLKSNMNTFDGWAHETILSSGQKYDWHDLKEQVVAQNSVTGVTKNDVLSSVQNWYCDYYLPSEIFVTAKGTKIEDYLGAEFTGKEACWIDDGYLVVNFDFITVDNSNERLTYNCLIHSVPTGDGAGTYTGLCDMWRWEGYILGKMDTDGIAFPFEDGDIFMYEIGGSNANSDYTNGGTH